MNLKNLFTKKNDTPEAFWTWFRENLKRLRAQPPEVMIGEVNKQFQRAYPGLIMEFGLEEPLLVVISGDGLKENIPKVKRAVAEAPIYSEYRVVAFRQPSKEAPTVRIGEVEADLSLTRCRPTTRSGSHVDIELFVPVPNIFPEDVVGQLGFIALDHILGEEAVMTRIGDISFYSIEQAPEDAVLLTEFLATL